MTVPDEFPGHSKDLFCVPKHYLESIASVLIPHGVIQERIKKIARDILKDVLKENEAVIDPTENICLDDNSAILSKQEETETILDLVNDETDSYKDIIEDARDGNQVLELDPLAITSDFSYNLDLHSILDDYEYPRLQLERASIFSSVGKVSDSPVFSDMLQGQRQTTIGVKSFAKVIQKKESVHFLCILKAQTHFVKGLERLNCPSVKGGYKFFLDLLDHVNRLNCSRSKTSIQVALDFIKVDSVDRTVRIDGIDDLNVLKDSNIVVVEDIVDTGKIMGKLVAKLQEYSPKRILIACLLRKRSRVQCYTPNYTGFEVPNKFLVGYALDFNEYFRDLMHICILSKTGLEKYKN